MVIADDTWRRHLIRVKLRYAPSGPEIYNTRILTIWHGLPLEYIICTWRDEHVRLMTSNVHGVMILYIECIWRDYHVRFMNYSCIRCVSRLIHFIKRSCAVVDFIMLFLLQFIE